MVIHHEMIVFPAMVKGLQVVFSVDWEGVALDSENIKKIQTLKKKWAIPLVHFVSPAYLTHPQISAEFAQNSINSVIDKNDERGLHIHCQRHFIEASAVAFRAQPSFSVAGDSHNGALQGQEVMLLGYSLEEFRKILVKALQCFQIAGWDMPRSFRAGGWMISPEQLNLLPQMGFNVDSSAVSPDLLRESCWANESLFRYAKLLWGDITSQSQPYFEENSSLLQIPNNWGAIDYLSESQLIQLIECCCVEENVEANSVFCITAHQESFAQCFDRIGFFIEEILRRGGQFTTASTIHQQMLHDRVRVSQTPPQQLPEDNF